jgi:replicative DNA helicase
MKNINYQIQRIVEKYKTQENKSELKKDLQSLLLQLNDNDLLLSSGANTIGALASSCLLQLNNSKVLDGQFIKTGFSNYDNEFGGLLKGETLVIGGRPGMGKTQLIVNLATNISSQGKACGLISLELSSLRLTNRFICLISKLNPCDFSEGKIEKQNMVNLDNAFNKLNTLPIFIFAQKTNSLASIIERCNELVSENMVEVIFIDYIQLIGLFNPENNYETELAQATMELKKVAKDLNIVLVVASQLSRQVDDRPLESKRPQLSDLGESGAIEQNADKVLFIYRPEYYGIEFDENNESTKYAVELIMAKNNSGYCETIKLTSERGFTGFIDYKGA